MTDKKYRTIVVTKRDSEAVLLITLNRPDVHNAFNSETILELTDAFDGVKKDDSVRVVILTGEGKSFCAGADINWMREIVDYSFDQNPVFFPNHSRFIWLDGILRLSRFLTNRLV